MHSELYRGSNFAAFPLMMFMITFVASYIVLNFSTLSTEAFGSFLAFLGLFMGLTVGTIGFSSSDMLKNVFGPTNFLIYSSRTLPVSRKRLLGAFLVKDLIYYTGLFLLPVFLGFFFVDPSLLVPGMEMFGLFFVGLPISIIIARSSLHVKRAELFSYSDLSNMRPLTAKSVTDLSRSSGGVFKILFSVGLITGFYWFTLLYFPAAQSLLTNPLLSFAAAIGMVNLTVYNWLNSFDQLEDYLNLPVDKNMLLDSKKKAYLAVTIPLTALLICLSYLAYPGHLVMALITGFAINFYTAEIASRITGLNPNQELLNSKTFAKYLVMNSAVVIPLLLLTVFYDTIILEYSLFIVTLLLIGVYWNRPGSE
ncbi:MAG: hypothetical protein ABEJ99_03070 [Candidatus Nanohaloarchaea archaeon]